MEEFIKYTGVPATKICHFCGKQISDGEINTIRLKTERDTFAACEKCAKEMSAWCLVNPYVSANLLRGGIGNEEFRPEY